MKTSPATASPTKIRIVLGITLLLALMVAWWAWLRVIPYKEWVTGARKIVVESPDDGGEITYRGDHFLLPPIIDQKAVWTYTDGLAPSQTDVYRGLIRLEPENGRGFARWPVPEDLLPFQVRGALPQADEGRLAWVYHTKCEPMRMVVAIAGREGWLVEPTVVAVGSFTKLLGLAWFDGALEATIQLTRDRDIIGSESDLQIVRINPGEPAVLRTVSRRVLCGGPTEFCPIPAAFLLNGEGSWHFAVYAEGRAFLSTENGKRREMPGADEFNPHRFNQRNIEMSALGVLRERPEAIFMVRMSDEGTLEPWTLMESHDFLSVSSHYVIQGEQLQRRWRYFGRAGENAPISRGKFVMVHAMDGQFIALSTVREDHGRMTLRVGASEVLEHTAAEAIVALDNGRLAESVLVPSDGGGFWLVSPDGHYLALDENLNRADPLSIIEHLLCRGTGHAWYMPQFVFYAAWLLFAFPLSLLFAGLLSLRGPQRPLCRTKSFLIGTIIYLLPALFFMSRLYEVLG